jgi:hypothetical protein
MNGALGLEASNPGLSRHFDGQAHKDQHTSARVAGVPFQIRNRHLPNTSIWPYGYRTGSLTLPALYSLSNGLGQKFQEQPVQQSHHDYEQYLES